MKNNIEKQYGLLCQWIGGLGTPQQSFVDVIGALTGVSTMKLFLVCKLNNLPSGKNRAIFFVQNPAGEERRLGELDGSIPEMTNGKGDANFYFGFEFNFDQVGRYRFNIQFGQEKIDNIAILDVGQA